MISPLKRIFPNSRKEAEQCLPNSRNCEVFFDLGQKSKELEALNKELSEPDSWNDQQKTFSLQKKKKQLERDIRARSLVIEMKEELEVLLELV